MLYINPKKSVTVVNYLFKYMNQHDTNVFYFVSCIYVVNLFFFKNMFTSIIKNMEDILSFKLIPQNQPVM